VGKGYTGQGGGKNLGLGSIWGYRKQRKNNGSKRENQYLSAWERFQWGDGQAESNVDGQQEGREIVECEVPDLMKCNCRW